MRFVLFVFALLPLAAMARSVEVPTLAPSAFADTESVTNVVFDAGGVDDRQFDLSVALEAAVSNNVEVAFGRDDDGDGVLSRAETDVELGWDAGAWFRHDRRAGVVERVQRAEGRRRLDARFILDSRKGARSLTASDGDGSVFSGTVASTMFDGSWNLMRVTVRGLVDPDGIVVSEVSSWGFEVIVR